MASDSWSSGEQIYYLDGFAYGLDSGGNTICMGTEQEIKATIEVPKRINPVIDNIIEIERQIIHKEKEGYGRRPEGTVKHRTQKLLRPSDKRIRPLHYLGHKRSDFRPTPTAKKLTLPIA